MLRPTSYLEMAMTRLFWFEETRIAGFRKLYGSGSRTGLEPKNAVVKRSYSRATFRSFHLTLSHSCLGRKPFTFYCKACETRVNIQGTEFATNQIPPSALPYGASISVKVLPFSP